MNGSPTYGSLFSGIDGLGLGLERAGWIPRWQVEYDRDASLVLAKRWPDVVRYGDVTTVDFSTLERVDLIAGGFPCQPVSVAGRRRGVEDERWLWPYFAGAIRELRPSVILVENVPGLLMAGGGRDAPVAEVLGDLATLGYDAEWDRIGAVDVGAPHLRNRIWLRGVRQRAAQGRVSDSGGEPVRVER